MRKVFSVAILLLIIFLVLVAAIPQLNAAVTGALKNVGGASYVAVAAWWAGIVANPVYLEFHMLIWFVGGIIFTLAMLTLQRRGKIPRIRGRQRPNVPAPMQGPQTVILAQPPTPTGTAPPQPIVQPVPPVDPNKPSGT